MFNPDMQSTGATPLWGVREGSALGQAVKMGRTPTGGREVRESQPLQQRKLQRTDINSHIDKGSICREDIAVTRSSPHKQAAVYQNPKQMEVKKKKANPQ